MLYGLLSWCGSSTLIRNPAPPVCSAIFILIPGSGMEKGWKTHLSLYGNFLKITLLEIALLLTFHWPKPSPWAHIGVREAGRYAQLKRGIYSSLFTFPFSKVEGKIDFGNQALTCFQNSSTWYSLFKCGILSARNYYRVWGYKEE